MTYFVELIRVPPPCKKQLDFNVFRESAFSRDVLSPGMTAVFRVECVQNATDAVTLVMERAAGFPRPCVQLVFGGSAP